MPALGPVLGEDGTKNVIAYVRSLSGLAHDSLRGQLGKPLFEQNCAACHGIDGKGNQAVGAPNLTDPIWLYGSSEATIAEGINKGRHLGLDENHLPMPAHKASLGDGKIQILAAYVWGSVQGALSPRAAQRVRARLLTSVPGARRACPCHLPAHVADTP